MAVKKVLLYPAKKLRGKSTNIEVFDDLEFLELMQDLLDTISHYDAIGLAAPQIGVNKRVFVTKVDGKPQFFINPVVVRAEGSITFREGCLSFPNVFELIDRPSEVTIDAVDVDGREFRCELDGVDAVAAQHELDHLDGVLFIDRVSNLRRQLMIKKLKKVKKKYNIL